MKCLVVEDDEDVAELWRLELEARGLTVVLAPLQVDGVQKLLTGVFDAIVVDLTLPDGDGLAVVELAAFRMPAAEVFVATGRTDFPAGELFTLHPNVTAVFRKSQAISEMADIIAHRLERSSAA